MLIHYLPGDDGPLQGVRRVFTAEELGHALGCGKPVVLATPGGGSHPAYEVTQTDDRFIILVGN